MFKVPPQCLEQISWQTVLTLTSPGVADGQRPYLSLPGTERILSKIYNTSFSSFLDFTQHNAVTAPLLGWEYRRWQWEEKFTEEYPIDNIIIVNTEILPRSHVLLTSHFAYVLRVPHGFYSLEAYLLNQHFWTSSPE